MQNTIQQTQLFYPNLASGNGGKQVQMHVSFQGMNC